MKKLLCIQSVFVLGNNYAPKDIVELKEHIIDGIDIASNFTSTGKFIELPDDFEKPEVEDKFLVFVEEIKGDEIIITGIAEMTEAEKAKVLQREKEILDAEVKSQKDQKAVQNSYDALRLIADFQKENNSNHSHEILKRAHQVSLDLKAYAENFQFKLMVNYLRNLKTDALLTQKRLDNLITHFEKM
jgi:ribosomal protein L14E/L6E/L27E